MFFFINQKVEGFGDKLTKLKLLNKTIWILLIKPNNVHLSTKEVFKNFSNNFSIKLKYHYNYKNLLYDINTNKNDLQKAAETSSPLFSKFLNNLPIRNDILTIPKMTGSGSTIFILFKDKSSALDYMKKINEITQRLLEKNIKSYSLSFFLRIDSLKVFSKKAMYSHRPYSSRNRSYSFNF